MSPWVNYATSLRKSSRLLVRLTLPAICLVALSTSVLLAETNIQCATTPVDIETQFAPGSPLEVFLIQGNNLPEQSSGTSLASLFDERMPTLGYKAVLEERELAPFLRSRLGLLWTGQFLVTERGRHVFSLVNLTRSGSLMNCRANVTLQDQIILTFSGTNETVVNEVGFRNPGLCNLKIWLVCDVPGAYNDVSFQMRMRGPNDRTMILIPPNRFLHAR